MASITEFTNFIKDFYRNRSLIVDLTIRDFRSRYIRSHLGILWAFIQPTITILIFWFVFQVGFKSSPIDNYPFILWLITGMVPWFFFSEGLSNATNAIVENSYLVKKVVFRVSMLPVIKILTALIIHIVFVVMVLIIFALYGLFPKLHYIQVLYYLFSLMLFVLGLAWILSSLNVFLSDVGQLVGMIMQFLFWLTPIFWPISIIPEKYHFWIKLNPIFYIIEGYRNSFVYNIWFWDVDAKITIYFWLFTLSNLFIGALVFRRLRPHFADVL